MKNPKITHEEIGIIKRAQAGDELAFSRLFNRYKHFVDSLLFEYIKDTDEARDLTNIVFVKVHDKLSKFKSYDSFGGWLRILTRNTAIDYLRTVKSFNTIDDAQNLQTCVSENSEEKEVNQMTYNMLLDMFEDIQDPEQRHVCELFYKDCLTVKQIHKALNVPEGTIKSYLYRMRKMFRKKLNLC